MRPVLLLLACFAFLTASLPVQAIRILGMGRPSARQRQQYAYMLNGHRMRRPHPHGRSQSPAPQPVVATR